MTPKYVYVFFLQIIFIQFTYCQKIVKYEYNGGHGCIEKELLLYQDSTFLYNIYESVMFPIKHKMKGAYLLSDNQITLYTKKKLHFLIIKLENKYNEVSYRMRGNNILMYDEEELNKENENFIKDYNTLHLYTPKQKT